VDGPGAFLGDVRSGKIKKNASASAKVTVLAVGRCRFRCGLRPSWGDSPVPAGVRAVPRVAFRRDGPTSYVCRPAYSGGPTPPLWTHERFSSSFSAAVMIVLTFLSGLVFACEAKNERTLTTNQRVTRRAPCQNSSSFQRVPLRPCRLTAAPLRVRTLAPIPGVLRAGVRPSKRIKTVDQHASSKRRPRRFELTAPSFPRQTDDIYLQG